MNKLVAVACVILALVACKSGDDDDDTTAGTGGMGAGTGGMGAGTGGMVGSGGMGAGTGGMAAGTGGAAGAAGMGGALDLASCTGADTTAAPAALYASAAEVLAAMSPCGFGSCHVKPDGKAMLVLFDKMGAPALDVHAALAGKMSCEVPTMPLVDPTGGDAALKNSWMWHKLTGMADVDGKLASDAAWGTPGTCGQLGDQPFGSRMPANNGAKMASDERLGKIRNWICGGAPGPQ